MGSTVAEKFERLQKSGWRVVLLEKDTTTTQCHLLTRNMCITEPLITLRGRPIKCQGWKGERIGVNYVAWEGKFQHWL